MHKKRLVSRIIAAALCLFVLSPLQAGVYKWVDENGQVHYGERPGNTGAEKVTIRTNETTKPRAISKTDGDDEEQAEVPAKPEKPKVTKEEKRKYRKYCNEAKSDLTLIATRGRMREINAKGEYVYLGDEQKQQRISAAKKKKRTFCK